MGNENRTTKGNNTPIEVFYEDEYYYTTEYGYEVDRLGHSDEFMEQLDEKVQEWVQGALDYPGEGMDDDELEYIYDTMTYSSDDEIEHLTRVENGYHFEEEEYKVGDYLKNDYGAGLRSFSRTPEATLEYIKRNKASDITIYITTGDVQHFNTTNFNDTYSWEQESWVDQSSLRINKVTMYTRENSNIHDVLHGLGNWDNDYSFDDINSVRLVEISQE